ncbi:hypothetical protein OG887_30125 [Streptomyces sp. NBC_00053]|uniref:hypothetical protein n=1 Tax=unclassified Streptomyces TaxID=2593676 RepID=UPI00224E9231|nr:MULTISPECIES: hypothetical protein [unclassified Streptomyces]MCX4393527.1 hypothetical protein [Streptomyces sp. NBC_01767]MCX5503597.1 hypothetical protein [Streptomyces sp. NBC_00052]MCX5547868.1 hypothetical protein [Streptomyces sp. NBC_00051]
MRRTGTTRRGVFGATGAIAFGAVLAGCGDGPGSGKDSGRSGAATAAEQASAARAEKKIRAAAARTSLELLGGYEHVVRAHPATAAGLAPLRDAVRAHAKALAPGGAQALAFTRSRATDARSAVRELAAAERRAADAHLAALMEAPPELARLLASIAAAGAAHAYLLTGLAKETSS